MTTARSDGKRALCQEPGAAEAMSGTVARRSSTKRRRPCEAMSTSTAQSASSTRSSNSRGATQVLMAWTVAPTSAAPKRVSSHSIRLLMSSPTRSPRRTPSERRAVATASALVCSAPNVVAPSACTTAVASPRRSASSPRRSLRVRLRGRMNGALVTSLLTRSASQSSGDRSLSPRPRRMRGHPHYLLPQWEARFL